MNTTHDEECPTGTTHLATQVAGHACDDKNYSFGKKEIFQPHSYLNYSMYFPRTAGEKWPVRS